MKWEKMHSNFKCWKKCLFLRFVVNWVMFHPHFNFFRSPHFEILESEINPINKKSVALYWHGLLQ